jgi:hypothetical protein
MHFASPPRPSSQRSKTCPFEAVAVRSQGLTSSSRELFEHRVSGQSIPPSEWTVPSPSMSTLRVLRPGHAVSRTAEPNTKILIE